MVEESSLIAAAEKWADAGENGIRVKIDLSDPAGDFWVDNGLIVLSELVGEGDFEIDYVLNKLVNTIVKKTGNLGEYYDINAASFEKYEKQNWRYPTNVFIHVSPKTEKKEINGEKVMISPPVFELKMNPKGDKRCGICGRTGPAEKGKQWMYPFLVSPDKFGNFYSFSRGGIYLCPRCSLAGLAGYLAWTYAIGGSDYMHIFLFHSDMETLLKIRRGLLRRMSESENKSRNVKMAFYGEYLHETTLGLLLSVFSYLHSREEETDPETMKLLAELDESLSNLMSEIKLYAISGKPGQGFNMSAYSEFSKISALYSLYKKWIEGLGGKFPEESSLSLLNRSFEQFYISKNRKTNSIWRDKIAWAVLEFNDPFPHIESYLYDGVSNEKEENRWGLKKGTIYVFETYLKEVLKMEEKHAKILAGFGHELGRTCAEREDMGVLYSLRNAKNIDDFLKVLNDINFKMEMQVNEELLKIDGEKIMGQPWIRVKTLISIYAMNSYLWKKKKKGGA